MSFLETNPIPVKAALAAMDLIQEEYRLPLCRMSGGTKRRLLDVLQAHCPVSTEPHESECTR